MGMHSGLLKHTRAWCGAGDVCLRLMMLTGLLFCLMGVDRAFGPEPQPGVALYVVGFLLVGAALIFGIAQQGSGGLLIFAAFSALFGAIGIWLDNVPLAVALATVAPLVASIFRRPAKLDRRPSRAGVLIAIIASGLVVFLHGVLVFLALSDESIVDLFFILLFGVTGGSAVFASESTAEVWAARPRRTQGRAEVATQEPAANIQSGQ